jgi:hypothetical protein
MPMLLQCHNCKAVLHFSIFWFLLAIFNCAYSAQLKLKHDEFTVSSVSSNWCASVVHLKVQTAQPAKIFNPPDSAFLQINLLGKVRAIASFNCQGIEKIVFTGWSGGRLYYAAVANKDNKWQLKGLYAPP